MEGEFAGMNGGGLIITSNFGRTTQKYKKNKKRIMQSIMVQKKWHTINGSKYVLNG